MTDINNKINDETLEGVAGGAIFNSSNIIGSDSNKHWEVIDDKGNVRERFGSKSEAEKYASDNNLGKYEIDWNEVLKRRG